MPELVGALMVHGQRVDMVREAEDRLLIPVCPPGVYLAEVRAAGVCVLYGHVEVLPSPLYEQEGVVSYTIDVDAMTDVLAVSLSMVEGIPGPRGEQGIQGERGLQGASAYDLAVAAGYEGSEAEWVAELQGAHAAANAAKVSETAAAKSARAAEADKTAAELARDDAQAAKEVAAAKAEKATEAAEAAQAPESLAVQAARPATMLLVKDKLMSILGDASSFDLDTDGQKIIVYTDRLEEEQLTAVTDMLERFVPQFIEVVNTNYLPMERIMMKLPPLLDSALGGEGRHNLNYDEATATLAVEIAYPNLDDESAAAVNEILAYELPPEMSGSCGYGVTPHVVDYLVNEYGWASNGLSAIFPNSLYAAGFALPKSMPLPTVLANRTDWRGIFANSNVTQVPDSFTFDTCTLAGGAYGPGSFENCPLLKRLPETVTLRLATNAGQFAYGTKLEKLPDSLRLDNVTELRRAFWCDDDTMPPNVTLHKAKVLYQAFTSMKLRTLPENCHLYSLTDSAHVFDAALFDKETALRIFDDIPVTNSSDRGIGIGIHIDYENDADILAAIENAKTNKNWIVSVRYNGTRTSPASTMAMGTLIYAKVGEMERPDGTTEQYLDWGHYVTNWEERGYEQFRSLESAYRYFGLPEDD